MKDSMKNILITMLMTMKAPLLKYLEKEAVKIAIAKFVQSPFMFDFRAWLVKFIVDYLAENIVKPVIEYFFRKVGYEYEVLDGKHLLKEIQNSPDLGTWDANADRV